MLFNASAWLNRDVGLYCGMKADCGRESCGIDTVPCSNVLCRVGDTEENQGTVKLTTRMEGAEMRAALRGIIFQGSSSSSIFYSVIF